MPITLAAGNCKMAPPIKRSWTALRALKMVRSWALEVRHTACRAKSPWFTSYLAPLLVGNQTPHPLGAWGALKKTSNPSMCALHRAPAYTRCVFSPQPCLFPSNDRPFEAALRGWLCPVRICERPRAMLEICCEPHLRRPWEREPCGGIERERDFAAGLGRQRHEINRRMHKQRPYV